MPSDVDPLGFSRLAEVYEVARSLAEGDVGGYLSGIAAKEPLIASRVRDMLASDAELVRRGDVMSDHAILDVRAKLEAIVQPP